MLQVRYVAVSVQLKLIFVHQFKWLQLTESQTSFPLQYVHRSVCIAANHVDSTAFSLGCLLVTAKLLQNEHFLYGTCSHNCRVWQQRENTCPFSHPSAKISVKRIADVVLRTTTRETTTVYGILYNLNILRNVHYT